MFKAEEKYVWLVENKITIIKYFVHTNTKYYNLLITHSLLIFCNLLAIN